jgi:DNA processing protein
MHALGTETDVLAAPRDVLLKVPGIGSRTVDAIFAAKDFDAQHELAMARQDGVQILGHPDKAYPPLLREIFSPPLVLYVRGELPPPESRCIAVVGTRRCSPYGRKEARRLGRELAARGFVVVSGMARGVDTQAHEGALEAEGRTVAVLGSGVMRAYPAENKRLLERIVEGGAVVSEFHMHAPPDARNFLRRNRIISGLSLGVLVIEAAMRSGALSTARWALEQDREVFALPGRIDAPKSAGTNYLISCGARIVTSVEDIVEEMPRADDFFPKDGETRKEPPLKPEEESVLACLTGEDLDIEELTVQTNMPVEKLSVTLLMLEMKGLVRQYPGKTFGAEN